MEEERLRQEEERAAREQKIKDEQERRVREYREEQERKEREYKEEQARKEAEWKIEQERRDAEYEEMQAKREQEEKERQVDNFMFLRFIKTVLKTNSQLEQAKQTLFSHRTFNLEDAFRMFDRNKNGVISAQEFHDAFLEQNVEVMNLERIVDIID